MAICKCISAKKHGDDGLVIFSEPPVENDYSKPYLAENSQLLTGNTSSLCYVKRRPKCPADDDGFHLCSCRSGNRKCLARKGTHLCVCNSNGAFVLPFPFRNIELRGTKVVFDTSGENGLVRCEASKDSHYCSCKVSEKTCLRDPEGSHFCICWEKGRGVGCRSTDHPKTKVDYLGKLRKGVELTALVAVCVVLPGAFLVLSLFESKPNNLTQEETKKIFEILYEDQKG